MRFEKLMTTLCYARVWYTADHCASCYALTHRLMQMPDHLAVLRVALPTPVYI